jgi:hypothetical protein
MTKAKVLCCVLAVLVVQSVSWASIPPITDGPYTTSTPISSTLTDWSGSLAFPKFNSALGTLTKVQLDLSGSLTTVLTVTNDAPTGSSGNAKMELQMTVQDAGINLNVPELDLFSPEFSYLIGAGQSVTSNILTKSGTSSDQYTSAPIIAEFTGPGTIVLPASTFTQTWLTNTGGNTFVAQSTYAQLTGTVTYTYTPVPEPATLSLLGLGLVGLVKRRFH